MPTLRLLYPVTILVNNTSVATSRKYPVAPLTLPQLAWKLVVETFVAAVVVGAVGEPDDAHAGIDQQGMTSTADQIRNALFPVIRFVDGEEIRTNPVDFEPGLSGNRDSFQGSIRGTRQFLTPGWFARC